jgi:2-haloalkanoic acid dehalogenase type II
VSDGVPDGPSHDLMSGAMSLESRFADDRSVSADGRRSSRTSGTTKLAEWHETLPPHSDVAGALEMLRGAGIPFAALTKGTLKGAVVQLRNARLAYMLDHVFSVDQVKTYKPAPKPSRFAARGLGVKPRMVYLVAAHAWDIAGAPSKSSHTATGRTC